MKLSLSILFMLLIASMLFGCAAPPEGDNNPVSVWYAKLQFPLIILIGILTTVAILSKKPNIKVVRVDAMHREIYFEASYLDMQLTGVSQFGHVEPFRNGYIIDVSHKYELDDVEKYLKKFES